MLGNSRKPGVLPVCFAALLFTFVYPCAPPGRTRKCSTTPLNPVGHIRKYSEILGNTRKCLEIPGNTRKYSETRGAACALRCTPVYPCGVPLCTPDTEMHDNLPQFVGKYAEILGNTRKCTEILGNTRKYSEILGNKGFCMCASLHPCVSLCKSVYHPEVLGNARQYPSIRWEILGNTRKYSEKLGNTRKYPEILGNTRKQGVLPVCFAAPLCTPVYPCIPPGNTRK